MPTETHASPELSVEQITELLHHDPFDDAPGRGSGEGPAPEPMAAPVEPVAPVVAPVEPAVVEPPKGNLPDVETLVAVEVERRLRAMQPPAKPEPEKVSGPTSPDYMFEIPDKLMGLIGSEDPAQARQGMQFLVAGALRVVHQTVMQEVMQQLTSLREELPQTWGRLSQQQEAQRSIATDFYGANPDLDVPEFRQLVTARARALAQSNPALARNGWSAAFRDALATDVRGILKWPSPQGSPPANGAAPPKMLKGGTRPSGTQSNIGLPGMEDLF